MNPGYHDISFGQTLGALFLLATFTWLALHLRWRYRSVKIWGRHAGFQAPEDSPLTRGETFCPQRRCVRYTHPFTGQRAQHLDPLGPPHDWRKAGDGVELLVSREPPHAVCSVRTWWHSLLTIVFLLAWSIAFNWAQWFW